MKIILSHITRFFKTISSFFYTYLIPGNRTLNGAAAGIAIATFVSANIFAFYYVYLLDWKIILVQVLGMSVASVLAGFLSVHLIRLISKMHFWLLASIIAAMPFGFMYFNIKMPETLVILAVFLAIPALMGGSVSLLFQKDHNMIKKGMLYIFLLSGLTGFAVVTYWMIQPGKHLVWQEKAAIPEENLPQLLDADNPGLPGYYIVNFLTYGSGTDKLRREYGAEANLITQTVDASPMLQSWKGFSGKMRTRDFGFDNKALPLNGRVWYPEGEGPFPLVLMVHGNHFALDFSDPGYAYLGELLASRGFIAVSVDQNFLNGSWSDFHKGLTGENNVRGWLLLKHLEVWKSWNADRGNPFSGKVDMDNIALIGHSRGGEAVGHAALFNKLPMTYNPVIHKHGPVFPSIIKG
jgi:hypothetical protein